MVARNVIDVLSKTMPPYMMAVLTLSGTSDEVRFYNNGTENWQKYAENGVLEVDLCDRPSDVRFKPTGDYIATIEDIGGKWEVSERYYPTDGEFGKGYMATESRAYDSLTQINIFGTWAYFANAVKSVAEEGNSTRNHRRPIEIYI